ncbi:ketopantoate reductase family protein [Falsiroseomonas selenitidurans]|uniref:2-dehydropantoate 2-reductase n=1 Tax=Falsiroseomonas selenitidurans TaxID=2716335 RepID=A0ABX1E0Z7_9PROT|nr:ketopantoate reductase family protein [Falsiroseomonas selenitidurans]NKC30345.1 ketopantoate reductase family protein [Falsiroseomonas selenitidurans]
MAEPIVIWGAGAIGGTLGAHWARAGHAVLLVDTVAAHVEACRTTGLRITGPVSDFTQVIPAVTPAELTGTYARIVLAVKAQATAAAIPMLAPHLAPDGFVFSAQNGLNEIALSRAFGADRVMGCFVNFGADWHGPGEILFGNRSALVIGELDGVTRPRTEAMFALCRDFEPDAILTDDIWSYLWGKMAYGAMLFATALNNDSMSANFGDPARLPVWLALGREVVATALAHGVTPRGFGDFHPMAFAPGVPDAEGKAVVDWLRDFNAIGAKTHSGIWRDLAVRRRKTEAEAQIGLVPGLAAEKGIPVPVTTRVCALIAEIEAGSRAQSAETFMAIGA